MDRGLLPEVKKIAVLRANAVGDFIVALPALDALRRAYPDAEIVLLAGHWHADFLASRPGPVDRVVVVPYAEGVYEPRDPGKPDQDELKRFFADMSRERFDIAFQLHGGGKNSNEFVRNLGARLTAGARTPDAPRLDRWVPYRRYQNEALRLLEIVALAGASRVNLDPKLSLVQEDLEEAEKAVPADARPLVVMSPGSRDPRRRWPAAKFAAIADMLADRGARIVINGSPDEKSAARETLFFMKADAENVCGSLSLRGLAGLLSRSKLLVSNNSGPLHLAEALRTPCVGVYWFGNVLTYGPIRFGQSAVHVSWRLHCPVCGAHCMDPGCDHRDSFVSDVSIREVAESAIELFEQEAVGS